MWNIFVDNIFSDPALPIHFYSTKIWFSLR